MIPIPGRARFPFFFFQQAFGSTSTNAKWGSKGRGRQGVWVTTNLNDVVSNLQGVDVDAGHLLLYHLLDVAKTERVTATVP